MDRIDLHLSVPEVKHKELTSAAHGERSHDIAKRVRGARKVQLQRFAGGDIFNNAHMGAADIRQHCVLPTDTLRLLEEAIQQLGFSARAYNRILKVARTVADLTNSKEICSDHVAEAIQYRSLDRNFWDGY